MVKIADNLYADQTEIRNIDWKEYITWLEYHFGEKSDIYELALPDSTVWAGEITLGTSKIYSYFSNPSFQNYPVVGISYQQAKAYCEWRTDRVAENILIHKGILKKNEDSPKLNILETSSEHGIYLPTFRLPTEEEWEIIASGGLNIEEHPLGFTPSSISNKSTNTYQHNARYPDRTYYKDEDTDNNITAPVQSFLPNNFGIYNSVGNVAEMVHESGISKGGSYCHGIEACAIENRIIYAKPEKWLGFRCVAYYDLGQFVNG